ncbi:cuticlin 2-like [Manacus candei]|uniref:cuticlin 2-like n=1 Tax=Manacus candei TaxID=415023 RepID=UPI002226F9CD|nr:cuticlin 2-like [Manacus candei]
MAEGGRRRRRDGGAGITFIGRSPCLAARLAAGLVGRRGPGGGCAGSAQAARAPLPLPRRPAEPHPAEPGGRAAPEPRRAGREPFSGRCAGREPSRGSGEEEEEEGGAEHLRAQPRCPVGDPWPHPEAGGTEGWGQPPCGAVHCGQRLSPGIPGLRSEVWCPGAAVIPATAVSGSAASSGRKGEAARSRASSVTAPEPPAGGCPPAFPRQRGMSRRERRPGSRGASAIHRRLSACLVHSFLTHPAVALVLKPD